MNSKSGCIFFILLAIVSCVSNPTIEPDTISLFKKLSTQADQRYSVWKANKDGPDSQSLFYGLEGKYGTISNRTNGHGLASGWDQIIFYRNITKYKNLSTITIVAQYTGDPGKQWSFSVDDSSGLLLFSSPRFRFDLFSNNRYTSVEFDSPVSNIPKDFIIRIKTGSNPTDSLFILLVDENQKHRQFSYEYLDAQTYKVLETGNYSVFPEFN